MGSNWSALSAWTRAGRPSPARATTSQHSVSTGMPVPLPAGQQWVSALISTTPRWEIRVPLGPTPALVYRQPGGRIPSVASQSWHSSLGLGAISPWICRVHQRHDPTHLQISLRRSRHWHAHGRLRRDNEAGRRSDAAYTGSAQLARPVVIELSDRPVLLGLLDRERATPATPHSPPLGRPVLAPRIETVGREKVPRGVGGSFASKQPYLACRTDAVFGVLC